MPDSKLEALIWFLSRLQEDNYFGGVELTFKSGEIVLVRQGQTLVMETIVDMYKKEKK